MGRRRDEIGKPLPHDSGERFVWQKGDVVITHDPYAQKYRDSNDPNYQEQGPDSRSGEISVRGKLRGRQDDR